MEKKWWKCINLYPLSLLLFFFSFSFSFALSQGLAMLPRQSSNSWVQVILLSQPLALYHIFFKKYF